MSGLGNKKIMAKNIRKYMDATGVKPKDVCDVLHIPLATFSDWINAKTYPRIDKIEMLSNYFGISKADLVEENTALSPTKQEKDIEKIVNHMREQLTSEKGLMFDGEPATQEAIESILSAMRVGVAMAKEENKKYIPKKYRKE